MGKGKRSHNADYSDGQPVKRKRQYKRDPTTMYSMNYGYTGIGPRCQRPYRRYTEADLFRIADQIKRGELSIKKAARVHRMSEEVLRRGVEGLGLKALGRQKALTNEEERTLVIGIESCVQWGLIIHKRDIQFIIKYYLDAEPRKNQLTNNLPRDDFLKAVMKRYRQLFDIVPRSRKKQIILTKNKVDTLNGLMVMKQQAEDVVDPLGLFPFDISVPPKILHKKHPNYMLSCWRNAFAQYFKDCISKSENNPKLVKDVPYVLLEAKKKINRREEMLLYDIIISCKRRWLNIYKSEIIWLVTNFLDVQNRIENRFRGIEGPGVEWLEDFIERFDMMDILPMEYEPKHMIIPTRMIEGSYRKLQDKVGLFPLEKNSFTWNELNEKHPEYIKHCWKYVFLRFLSHKDIKIVFYEGSENFRENTKNEIIKVCNQAIAQSDSAPAKSSGLPNAITHTKQSLQLTADETNQKLIDDNYSCVFKKKKRIKLSSSTPILRPNSNLSLKNIKIVANQLGQHQLSLLKKNYDIDFNDLKEDADVKIIPLPSNKSPNKTPTETRSYNVNADDANSSFECDTIVDETTYECPDVNNTVIDDYAQEEVSPMQNNIQDLIQTSDSADKETAATNQRRPQSPEVDRIKVLKAGEYVIIRILQTDSSSYVAQVEQILKGSELDTIVVSILQPCNPGRTIFVLPDEEVRVMMQRSHVLRVIKDPVVKGDKLHFKRRKQMDMFEIS